MFTLLLTSLVDDGLLQVIRVRESIEGPHDGSQQLLGDTEKSLINGMCNVSVPKLLSFISWIV